MALKSGPRYSDSAHYVHIMAKVKSAVKIMTKGFTARSTFYFQQLVFDCQIWQ